MQAIFIVHRFLLKRHTRCRPQNLKIKIRKGCRNGKIIVTVALCVTFSLGCTSIDKFRGQILFAKTVRGLSERNVKAKDGLIQGRQDLLLFGQLGMALEKFPETILVFNESIFL